MASCAQVTKSRELYVDELGVPVTYRNNLTSIVTVPAVYRVVVIVPAVLPHNFLHFRTAVITVVTAVLP